MSCVHIIYIFLWKIFACSKRAFGGEARSRHHNVISHPMAKQRCTAPEHYPTPSSFLWYTFIKGLKIILDYPKHMLLVQTVVFDIAGEVWREAGGVCCYTGHHQCPDSSPAATTLWYVSFLIIFHWTLFRACNFSACEQAIFLPFLKGFSHFRLVMGSQSGIGCSNELSNFLSTSRGGDIRMIKVGCDHCIVLRSIKMCLGSNIFLCHSCTGAGKQVGGFWELGGRLGGPGFKSSSGNSQALFWKTTWNHYISSHF